MELSKEKQEQAARVQELIVQQDENGEYLYTDDEVRDFIVASIFGLNLPLDDTLERVLLKFCEQLEIPEETTEEEMVEYLRKYFEEHPLNPNLIKEFKELGRSELLRQKEGFKTSDEEAVSKKAAGNTEGPTAPRAAPAKRKDVKPKRGISKD